MTFTTTINDDIYTTTIQGPTDLPILWETLYDNLAPQGMVTS